MGSAASLVSLTGPGLTAAQASHTSAVP